MEIGPVPSASVLEYVRLAREQLNAARHDHGELSSALNPFVMEHFARWLDSWEASALAGPTFSWSEDVDPEVVEHAFYAFFLLVQKINQVHGEDGPPGDVDLRRPFRLALTAAVLDALESEGDSYKEFAQHLREYWPDSDFEAR